MKKQTHNPCSLAPNDCIYHIVWHNTKTKEKMMYAGVGRSAYEVIKKAMNKKEFEGFYPKEVSLGVEYDLCLEP